MLRVKKLLFSPRCGYSVGLVQLIFLFAKTLGGLTTEFCPWGDRRYRSCVSILAHVDLCFLAALAALDLTLVTGDSLTATLEF